MDLGEMISDITPQDRTADVDVFSAPQAAFNMAVDNSFALEDINGTKKSYRIKLVEFAVKNNGVSLPGKFEWNSGKTAVSFFSHDILPPKTKLQAVARVSLEESKSGRWVAVTGEGGSVFEEVKEISFTTGEAPTTIPTSNIEYCYPVINQRYFHLAETDRAYIQLKRGQEYLFAADLRHEIQITKGKEVYTQSVNYNSMAKRVEYTMPAIPKNSAFVFNILSFAISDGNVAEVTEKRVSVLSDDENEVTKRETQAADATSENGTSLLSYEFGTSSYGTFKEKVESIVKNKPSVWRYSEGVYYLEYTISSGEAFGVIDMTGSAFSKNPLVRIFATLSDDYYNQDISSLVYSHPEFSLKRGGDGYGTPPSGALVISTPYLSDMRANNPNSTNVKKRFPYIYDLPRIYKTDLDDLRTQITSLYKSGVPENYHYLVYCLFPKLRHGAYETTLRYMFPDGTFGSNTMFEFFNELR
jgi:hypothetical protein